MPPKSGRHRPVAPPAEPPRRGRPPHEPTLDTRALVTTLVARGKSVPDIALALGISAPTLRAHYRPELHAARAQKTIPLPEFAEPAPPRPAPEGSGRPPHIPTDDTRDEVAILLAGGMPPWQVAQAIGIAESTLRDHYAEQLDRGRARKRADMIVALHRTGIAGNVSAQKAYLAMDAELDDPPPAGAKPVAPIGKKAAAFAAAETAEAGAQ